MRMAIVRRVLNIFVSAIDWLVGSADAHFPSKNGMA